MKKIGIVIINFNSGKHTIDCINSFYEAELDGHKLLIVVLDNGSVQDDFIKVKNYILVRDSSVKRKNIDLTIIRNEENTGFSEGNNIGIRYALKQNVEYVILLNNDTIVDKKFIKEIVKITNNDEKIGIISPKILFAKGFEYHKERYKEEEKGKVIWYAGGIMDWKNIIGSHRGVDEVDKGQYDDITETDFATGCCMLIRKNVFEKIGYLDEKYFLYYEDNDFSQRARLARYKIMFAPNAVIWHKNAGSAGGSGSSLQDYYITRNRLMFGFKYASLRPKISLFRQSLLLLLSGRKYQKMGIIDYYLFRLGKGSYR